MALKTTGVTIQVRVGDIRAGLDFYRRLLGREPDLQPHEDFLEWELIPGCWLQVAEGTPTPGSGPVRLGVDEIEAERERIQREFGVTVTPVERIEGLAAWCNFTDPWGNRLGLFKDLAKPSGE